MKETVDATLNRISSSGVSGASYFTGSIIGTTRFVFGALCTTSEHHSLDTATHGAVLGLLLSTRPFIGQYAPYIDIFAPQDCALSGEISLGPKGNQRQPERKFRGSSDVGLRIAFGVACMFSHNTVAFTPGTLI